MYCRIHFAIVEAFNKFFEPRVSWPILKCSIFFTNWNAIACSGPIVFTIQQRLAQSKLAHFNFYKKWSISKWTSLLWLQRSRCKFGQ